MSGHTPGPWWLISGESPIIVRGGPDDNETYVCEIKAPWSNESARADARLIAAAPEMLDALKRVLAFEPSEGENDINDECRAAASAAIAKAEGR